MSKVESTRLKFVRSKDAEKLSIFIERLPFKVEIKNVTAINDIWFCWFVVPDDEKFKSTNLD